MITPKEVSNELMLHPVQVKTVVSGPDVDVAARANLSRQSTD